MKVDMTPYTKKMDKTLEVLQSQFAAVRAGRASAAVLDPDQRGILWCGYPHQSGWLHYLS